MLNSKNDNRMIILFSVLLVVFVLAVVVMLSRHTTQAIVVPKSDTALPTAVAFTHVVLPSAVQLSPTQITQIFSILETARTQYNADPATPAYRLAKNLDAYVYQLQPNRNSNNEIEVRVYGLPTSAQSEAEWAVSPLITRDGGVEYFDATINLTTGSVTDFSVHGEA